MYSVHDYGRMAADVVRMDAYARAIARAVKPGHVVVDLGAGTGIMSVLAARCGAKRVHAIDPNPAIFLLGDVARMAGVADRITIHHARSVEVELPERADVVVSDLRGTTPFDGDHLAVIRDARERLLRTGGRLIPERDRLFVALVESEEILRWISRGFDGFERFGIPSAPVRASILNTIYPDRHAPVAPEHVLSDAACCATVDYANDTVLSIDSTVELALRRAGTIHGLVVWFDATLLDDIGFTTAPGHQTVYMRMFLPLLEPIQAGDDTRARVTIRVDVRGERWAWEGAITTGDGTSRFRQSTFFGVPADPAMLLREASTYRPSRSPSGDRLRRLLDAMDGTCSSAELIARAAATVPDASPQSDLVAEEAREAISRYGR